MDARPRGRRSRSSPAATPRRRSTASTPASARSPRSASPPRRSRSSSRTWSARTPPASGAAPARRGARHDAAARRGARDRPHRRARRCAASGCASCSRAASTRVIPARGSVGASGDLAPLAHLALGMIGEGEASTAARSLPAARGAARAGLAPLVLEAKEGLALLNGTQHMTAVGGLALLDAERHLPRSPTSPARCRSRRSRAPSRAFDARVIAARPHPGQIAVGARTCARCSPAARSPSRTGLRQGAGPVLAALHAAGPRRDARRARASRAQVLEREVNASTDNPLVFVDDARRRRRDDLGRQLPRPAGRARARPRGDRGRRAREHQRAPRRAARQPAPVERAAAVPRARQRPQLRLHDRAGRPRRRWCRENKVLAHPASVDSIPSSAGREDHVSMGATARSSSRTIDDHVRTVLAIELLCAAQGLDLRRPLRTTRPLEAAHARDPRARAGDDGRPPARARHRGGARADRRRLAARGAARSNRRVRVGPFFGPGARPPRTSASRSTNSICALRLRRSSAAHSGAPRAPPGRCGAGTACARPRGRSLSRACRC